MAKDVEDVYELSPIQLGLLFEHLAQPGLGIYVEQLRLEFEGALDPVLFERAWQHVVDRHPILRTSFHWRRNGTAMQVVHRTARLGLETLDWRELDPAAQEQRLARWLDAERREGFALAPAPLMRNTLVRRGPESWTFAWRFSHLLMDGWSFTLAISDFLDHYRALHHGEQPRKPAARPYRDYLAWWRSRDTTSSRRFWTAELAGYEPFAQLEMGGGPVPAGERTHSYFERRLTDLAPRLADLARAEQLTLATIVQGAWLVVLGRYYGRDDVACGITMAHRPSDLAGAEAILGPMIATLPVRQRLVPTRALRAWLRDFGRHVAEASQHSSLPLPELQALVGPANSAPLLQSSVSYENVPMPDFDLSDVGAKMVDLSYDGRPHYPITMVIMPGDDMPLRVMYDRRKFSDVVAQGFADDLISVLRQIVDRPELTLGELSLGGAAEPETAAALTRGPDECLHETFREHARRTPDATAVRCGDRSLTYAELDRRSDLVAAALAGHGPELVGLCLNRSLELVVAILGVLKAGAAYVPIDPAYPADRLADMVRDAGVEVVLCTAELAGRVPPHDGRTLVLGTDVPLTGVAEAVPDAGEPGAPAYLLYTSGSTGRPKGVVVTHRNVQSLLAAGRQVFGFGAEDVWTFAHSFVFDYSVWEMWGALGNGGCLVVVPPEASREPGALRRLVRDERITVLSQTPAVFEHLVHELAADDELALRQVFLGGDRLEAASLRPWFERFGGRGIELYNLYGVTEATVVSTYHLVRADEVRENRTPPIGAALPNQRTRLVDEHGRPVPRGATGRLCVSGPAVARGYHRRPELDAERFGDSPFDPGERWYHTGDLASEGPDGALRFLGRSDSQIKIRGFRVELGEIEAVLREHPAVRSATVVATGRGSATRLAGYVVPVDTPVAPAFSDELKQFAARRLPEHMVPVALCCIPEIPTTPGGKIDTAALPPVDWAGTADFVAPRNRLETEIGAAVAEILGVDRVGVLDRLDELGLHSVGAMRLMARLKTAYLVEMPLPELLATPTVEHLATMVGRPAD